MARLTLELLGPPQIQLNGATVTTSRRVVLALLAYLAVSHVNHPQSRHTRESLSSLFWASYGQSRALALLRHTLWDIAKSIGSGWVLAEHQTIHLNPAGDIQIDVENFHFLFHQASEQPDPSLRLPILLAASKLYRDTLLAGFSLKDAPAFNDWVFGEAEKLRREFSTLLSLLIEDYCKFDQAESAIPYAQRLIALDPIRETSHTRLLYLYALTGQQALAVQHYQVLEKLLRKELNVDPQPETRELYRKIRRGAFTPVPSAQMWTSLKPSAIQHPLPLPLTNFIGREKELDQICRLIAQNRLVTLIGTGGIGKTRLSLQAGQTLLPEYQDGVWFISFDPLSDPDLVPKAVASYFGIAETAGTTIIESLIHSLKDRDLLLIFDNCEHLLDACGQLLEVLLRNCPVLRVLVTSREVLGLEGEVSYHVPALTIPQEETRSVEELAQYESIQLFIERAKQASSGFVLTRENSRPVADLCQSLGGIPLAIELAAARMDMFNAFELLKEISSSFDLLASSKRSMLPRHQTMRACINWSWMLLGEPEENCMRQLSVFAGGWTLAAAHKVCDQVNIELMSGLIKKSLIEVHQEAGHQTRYMFHKMVRQFAYEKLLQAGEEKIMRDRHLEYCLEVLQQLPPNLSHSEQDAAVANLFSERDNIRAALEWAARTNVIAGLYMLSKLRSVWENYKFDEGARWILTL